MNSNRVILFSDDPISRLCLGDALQEIDQAPSVCQIAQKAKLLDYSHFDENRTIFVLDINLFKRQPDLEDFIGRFTSGSRTIVLLQAESSSMLNRLTAFGLRVFLKKPFLPVDLKNALRALEQNRRYIDPTLSDSLTESFLGFD